jgi:large conductance mechanosensitive channel
MSRNGGLVGDFKNFLMQGNAVDLAIAVILGTAFGKIVTALVEKLFMPIISLVTPGGDWKNWMIPLGGKMTVSDPNNVGKMIEVEKGLYIGQIFGEMLNFLAIGLVVFFLVRALENTKKRFKRQEEIAAIEEPQSPERLLQERMATTLDRLADTLERR